MLTPFSHYSFCCGITFEFKSSVKTTLLVLLKLLVSFFFLFVKYVSFCHWQKSVFCNWHWNSSTLTSHWQGINLQSFSTANTPMPWQRHTITIQISAVFVRNITQLGAQNTSRMCSAKARIPSKNIKIWSIVHEEYKFIEVIERRNKTVRTTEWERENGNK